MNQKPGQTKNNVSDAAKNQPVFQVRTGLKAGDDHCNSCETEVGKLFCLVYGKNGRGTCPENL